MSLPNPPPRRLSRHCYPLLLWASLAVACGSSRALQPADAGDTEDDAAEEPADAADSGAPESASEIFAEPDDEAAYLFDQAALRTYELRLSPADLATLDANPQAEQYVEGSLLFEGKEYGPVGIRYKGSFGGWVGCTGSGGKTCTKLSLKIKLDFADPDAELYGLRTLLFHSMNNDPSMMKDRLSYWLFRQFGIPAPRAVHARLRINDQLNGVVALVEEIDGRFTRSRFAEGGKGNLYKEAWPLTADGAAITEEALRPALETNKDEAPSLDRFLRFGQLIEQSSDEQLPGALEHWLSMEHIVRYLAVDRATGNDDGVLHWYCVSGPCWNHNYFWYEEQRADRLWLIPWDMDVSFNLDNPIATLWVAWDDTSLTCESMRKAPFNLALRAPSCDKLTRGWAGFQERYIEALAELLEGPFRAELVEARLSEWEAQIAPAVEEAASLHADAVSLDAWAAAGVRLRDAIGQLRERAAARVAGE